MTRSSCEIEVSVKDEGIGIPAEVMPRLFQKFSRADNADTRRIGGTGLGLALILISVGLPLLLLFEQ